MEKNQIDGVIVLNKGKGISSAGASNRVKWLLKANKAGHLGTLDPLATGVLPIALGKATKLFDIFLSKHKVYEAIFQFGKETDTLDSEGTVTNSNEKMVCEEELKFCLDNFKGKIMQMPPQFSAKKVNGEKAYNLARKGIEVKLEPKEVQIFQIELLKNIDINTFKVFIECSSGTYIRSLCRDIAYKLGTYGTMIELVRTKCGIFSIENSFTMEDVENGKYKIIPLEDLKF